MNIGELCGLSPNELNVLVFLGEEESTHALKSGSWFWLSYPRVEAAGYATRSVRRYIEKFQKLGILETFTLSATAKFDDEQLSDLNFRGRRLYVKLRDPEEAALLFSHRNKKIKAIKKTLPATNGSEHLNLPKANGNISGIEIGKKNN